MKVPEMNLVIAWLWMLAGFVSGMLLGLGFHRETWLGGYTSHRRRLYRLGHISFFGLGTLNLLFYLTIHYLCLASSAIQFAGWGFALGAVSMPVCCAIMAHRSTWRALFLIPVCSLLVGGGL